LLLLSVRSKIAKTATPLRRKIKKIKMDILTQPFQRYFIQLQKLFQDQTFEPYQIQKIVDGRTFNFTIGDLDGQEWYVSSSPDRELNEEMKFMKERLIKPGEIIFECGTHHGWTTLLLSKWAEKEGKVIGFEINTNNALIAKKKWTSTM
jgi:hypothetical protein